MIKIHIFSEDTKWLLQTLTWWADYVLILSQIKSLLQLIFGYKEEAKATQENFIGLLVSFTDPFLFRFSCSPYYCVKPKPCCFHPDWMSKLDDTMLVTHVTMPGSHESACRTGGHFARCQTWSIGDQLKAGIRSLDIRCRSYGDKFQIIHGIINCHLRFDTVLKYCEDFLKENPSEFIVMRIRKEAGPIYRGKPFHEIYREYASRDVFLQTNKKQPTVGEVRSKIIVIKTFDCDGTGSEWNMDQLILQDSFEPASISQKLEEITKHHKAAKPDNTKFYINVTSACAPRKNLWPRHFARQCNKLVWEMLKDPKNQHFAGIVPMDFPSWGTIQEIIDLNFSKSAKSGRQDCCA